MVTGAMKKRMREARAAGKTLMQIAVEFGVSLTTVQRHVSDKTAEKHREYTNRFYQKIKEDPERYAKLRARVSRNSRLYRRRMKEERNAESNA